MLMYCRQVIILVSLVLLISACNETSIPVPLASATNHDQGSSIAAPSPQITTITVLPTAVASPSPTGSLPATVEINPDPTQDQDHSNMMETDRMNITIGDYVLSATLVDNSSVAALIETLSNGPITINMRDYGSMEKVGSLGFDLPRNDEQITTEAGDIILYQGNSLVIYYAPNSWDFTRLGKINNVTAEELREILGDGDVTITLSLPED